MGVRLFERMREDQWLQDGLTITGRGRDKLSEAGLELADLPPSSRPICRSCFDWSQRANIWPAARASHTESLSGAFLGAAVARFTRRQLQPGRRAALQRLVGLTSGFIL
jgi:hypothetical protein